MAQKWLTGWQPARSYRVNTLAFWWISRLHYTAQQSAGRSVRSYQFHYPEIPLRGLHLLNETNIDLGWLLQDDLNKRKYSPNIKKYNYDVHISNLSMSIHPNYSSNGTPTLLINSLKYCDHEKENPFNCEADKLLSSLARANLKLVQNFAAP